MFGVSVGSMGKMRMMRGRLVIAIRHVGGGFAMMLSRMLVMFGGMLMMFGGVFGVRHGRLPFVCRILRTPFNSVILRQTRDGWRRNSLAKARFVHFNMGPMRKRADVTLVALGLLASRARAGGDRSGAGNGR